MDKELEYLKKYLDPNMYEEGKKKLKEKIPVQYIVGHVDFYGVKINVNEKVLIPRFETEELVYETKNYISKYLPYNSDVVDLGTGSGCIAISLKKQLLSISVTAVDISEKALEVARQNADNNSVEIEFLNGDMLTPLTKKYDCIISNPPYIDSDDLEIDDIVKKNEPHLALFAPNNGLYFYEEILKNAKDYLKEKSMIAFEIGYKQSKDITNIAKKYFPNSNIVIKKDMQERERFVFIFNNIVF